MSTNLTIDDSSPDIIYSSDWAAPSEDDPNMDRFFQSTYHSAQGDGASANITFTGSAIYMYGTKGPGHANYSVQFDNFIMFFSASGSESQTSYQQLLFGRTFNTSGPHFVSLASRHVSSTENWLDLDYITITVDEADSDSEDESTSASASPPTASPTISPPWLSEASSTGDFGTFPSSPSTTLPSSNSDSSSTNRLTLILAAVFGSILAAAIIFGAGWVLARRWNKGSDNHLGLRAGTSGTGSGGGYGYKPPPSPSFFGGQMSPISPEPYSAQSPPYDGLMQDSDQDKQIHDPAHGHLHGVMADGRKSPHSTVSLGGATVLTAASTAYLLNPHPHKVADDTPGHRHSESTSTAVNRLDAMNIRARSPLAQPRQASPHLPIYKQHRVYDSESAINVLRGSAAALGVGHANDGRNPSVVVLPGSSKPSSLADSGVTTAPDSHIERSAPLMVLHAAHRSDSELPVTEPGGPGAPPQRPKRPGDGLLDFLGSQFAQRLERSATAKRRRDDANSERTNFLKV